MSKKISVVLFLFYSLFVMAQSEQLAYNYFDKGEYEKAISLLEDLVKKQPYNYTFVQKMVTCYQQLKQYDKAEKAIIEHLKTSKNPSVYIDLGYNYQLQKNQTKATENYNLALNEIQRQPNYAYSIAAAFEQKTLLDWAIKAYDVGKKTNPNLNFDYQVALINGQMGNLELMVEKLLDFSYSYPDNTAVVQNQLARFITEDSQGNFQNFIKKSLLTRVQKNQDIFWNQFLSWFFVQQKDYAKAFTQEKAIYKRNPEGFYNIINLAKFAKDDNDNETAKTIFQFILENTSDFGLQLFAHNFVISMEIEEASPAHYPVIKQKIESLLKQYGISTNTLELQILSAHFDAFYLKEFEKAKTTLQNSLSLNLSPRQESEIKMELADILVLDEKFNQAILYYAQISETLQNDQKSHEASMKMAKTSYYKQDFDWALQQVKVLKQSSSLLIANDAIELFLLISDNTAEDSTHVALKAFSKADFCVYQNKNEEALSQFLDILQKYKGNVIEAQTLLKIAQIYEKKTDFSNALSYYKQILNHHTESIFIDEALFFSAELYRKQLNQPEVAKPLYEKIIFEHPDSIYFTEAQKQFRLLRGDTL
ncbi:MAG TPA: hypothetical protein DDZ41_07615 [Flavobacterium sp.]|nr:hypothetical protein [Flavobacterium sp.]